MAPELIQYLKDYNFSIKVGIRRIDGCNYISGVNRLIDLEHEGECTFSEENAVWKVLLRTEKVENNLEAVDIRVDFKLEDGEVCQACTAISLEFDRWSKDNYVLMPSAAYNGNRFEARKMRYPPIFQDKNDLEVDIPTIVTDIPRLNINDGKSSIKLITRDLATPVVAFRDTGNSKGFWLLTEQATTLGDSGLELEESSDRNKAVISVTAPGVRYPARYSLCDMGYPSDDRGADFKPGDSVSMHIRLYFFICPEIQDLFDYFTKIRKDLTGVSRLHNEIPFSSAWNIQEDKYNRENWVDTKGYYAIGTDQNWQIGWVGGLMSTYPLLAAGKLLSRERALKTFDFVFREGQDVSGFFHGCADPEKFYGDHFYEPDKKWHLIRKSSDALYFILKQYLLLEKQRPDFKIPKLWLDGTRRCADAFVRLWQMYRQFGQFVDTGTGEIIVRGSVSAGSAPAGLALAAEYFGKTEYLEIAEEAAEAYYENYVLKGYTTGGPGEILQCPDSESAFGLLESFVVLYEVTGRKHWLEKAKNQANQCFTWIVSYDFRFPAQSTFGLMDMRTTGTVYASVQNKHSAPGICTLSGDSLFKLYRATGERRYLELIREIAHSIPQYLSREDRPIMSLNGGFMPAGWMNERVEMSDWLEPIGEIFYGSCWCEVSNMLTYVELPGLYVHTDTGFVCTIDNIDAEVIDINDENLVIQLTNPTKFHAKVRVFAEKSTDMSTRLGQNAIVNCPVVEIDPYGTLSLSLNKVVGCFGG